VSDFNIIFHLLVRRDGVLSTLTYEHYVTVNYVNNFCIIWKVSYNGGRKHRKLRNTKTFRKAYGCIHTDHIAAVKSWQGHQQHFLRNRPGDCPSSGHSARSTVFQMPRFSKEQQQDKYQIQIKLHNIRTP